MIDSKSIADRSAGAQPGPSTRAPSTPGGAGATPSRPRSSPRPGSWPAATGWRRSRCAIWPSASICVSRRCTCTSIRSSRCTTRCSSTVTASWSGPWRATRRPTIRVRRSSSSSSSAFALPTEDVVRHQLLFQRTIPGFKPSPEARANPSWRSSRSGGSACMASASPTSPTRRHLHGDRRRVTNQQVFNEPHGDRWLGQSRRVVEMFLADVEARAGRADGPTTSDCAIPGPRRHPPERKRPTETPTKEQDDGSPDQPGQRRTSRPTPPKAGSSSTTGSAIRGRSCSRTRRTSPRSAPPSSATWRSSNPSSNAAA